jgi:hypothetical protein
MFPQTLRHFETEAEGNVPHLDHGADNPEAGAVVTMPTSGN